MKKIILLLSFISTLAFAVDKQIIAPSGSVVVKGNSTVKMQTYNTGAWQDRFTITNNGTSTLSGGIIIGGNTTSDSNLGTISSVTNSSYYEGSFTVYFNDSTSYSTAGTAYYVKMGKVVSIYIPRLSFSGGLNTTHHISSTSGNGTCTWPSALLPSVTDPYFPIVILNNGSDSLTIMHYNGSCLLVYAVISGSMTGWVAGTQAIDYGQIITYLVL